MVGRAAYQRKEKTDAEEEGSSELLFQSDKEEKECISQSTSLFLILVVC